MQMVLDVAEFERGLSSAGLALSGEASELLRDATAAASDA